MSIGQYHRAQSPDLRRTIAVTPERWMGKVRRVLQRLEGTRLALYC
jgi:hypothetical protein